MKRTALLLAATLALAGCVITHYEARGQFGDTPAVLHWKDGDSAATLWRCGALPVPLTHGIQGHDPLASEDGCITVLVDDQPATVWTLAPGAAVVLGVQCEGGSHPPEGRYAFSALTREKQNTWFGLREPAIPDACTVSP